MPGLVPGIHVFLVLFHEDVDGRDKPGHDPRNVPVVKIGLNEPTIVAAPKAVEIHSAQMIAR